MTIDYDRINKSDTTMGLDAYIELEKFDRNAFWRLDSGHHQNLLDEAITRMQEAEAQIQHMSQSMIEPTGSPRNRMRREDHSTSAAGARAVTFRAASQKAKLLAVYGRFAVTDEEAAARCDLMHATYWMRCSELRTLGLIEETGETRKGTAGTERMVCRITERGRTVLQGIQWDKTS
jgi:hypothetical protein